MPPETVPPQHQAAPVSGDAGESTSAGPVLSPPPFVLSATPPPPPPNTGVTGHGQTTQPVQVQQQVQPNPWQQAQGDLSSQPQEYRDPAQPVPPGQAPRRSWDDHISVQAVPAQPTQSANHAEYDATYTVGGVPFTVRMHLYRGRTSARAMVVGGLHGSERGAVEVGSHIRRRLETPGFTPQYTVLFIEVLMAHNVACPVPPSAMRASRHGRHTTVREETVVDPTTQQRSTRHVREGDNHVMPAPYNHVGDLADPNRQAPTLGRGVDPTNPRDNRGRAIEPENYILLSLFNRFRPERILMLHGKASADSAGIYADPRTEANGDALGYGPDTGLAQGMAERAATEYAGSLPLQTRETAAQRLIRARNDLVNGNTRPNGGAADGDTIVNSIYPGDPAPAPGPDPATGRQHHQARYGDGQRRPERTWGSYFSTAVQDPAHPEQNRPAVTTLTLETPEYHNSTALGYDLPRLRQELQTLQQVPTPNTRQRGSMTRLTQQITEAEAAMQDRASQLSALAISVEELFLNIQATPAAQPVAPAQP